MRGGFVGVQVAVLLHGDAFPFLTSTALGDWLRLRAVLEPTGRPVSLRHAERLGVTPETLEELRAAKLLDESEEGYRAAGMPEWERPSDSPEARRERQEAYRLGISVVEYRARKAAAPFPEHIP